MQAVAIGSNEATVAAGRLFQTLDIEPALKDAPGAAPLKPGPSTIRIDKVQFGASDFSMSIGKTGQYGHPDVLAAETKTIQTALRMGMPPRVELRDPSQAKRYLQMGVKHFCIGWDVRILADWWDTKGADMRKMLRTKPGKAKAAPAKAPSRKGNGRDAGRGNYT